MSYQKVPQAQVQLTPSFDYTVRDLYLSFTDPSSNQWSILFDSIAVMLNYVRNLAACIFHVASHTGGTIPVSMKRPLPSPEGSNSSSSGGGSDGDTVLTMGMAAGVYLTAWEIGEPADYPGDVLGAAPLKRIQPPDDVLKVKYVLLSDYWT